MSQADQTLQRGRGDAPEKLASVDLPSFEMPSLESTDPDVTPTRWDIDASALDRAVDSSPAAEEIEVEDILEMVPVGGTLHPSGPARTLPPPPFQPARTLRPPGRAPMASIDLVLEEQVQVEPSYAAASFAPVIVEEASSRIEPATFLIPVLDARRRKAGLAWAIGLGLLAGAAIVGIGLRSAESKDSAQLLAPRAQERASVVATAPPLREAAGVNPGSPAPTLDVTNLPRAPVGTVSLAASASSHRLIVDGVVVPSGSAVVTCGKHLVKIGSRGRRQIVDVACGGETVVGQ